MNMYAYQDALPPLPLPGLEDSSKELLEWSAVFLSEKELLQTKNAIHQFSDPSGVGPLLQEKLAEMAANPAVTNWLEPF